MDCENGKVAKILLFFFALLLRRLLTSSRPSRLKILHTLIKIARAGFPVACEIASA